MQSTPDCKLWKAYACSLHAPARKMNTWSECLCAFIYIYIIYTYVCILWGCDTVLVTVSHVGRRFGKQKTKQKVTHTALHATCCKQTCCVLNFNNFPLVNVQRYQVLGEQVRLNECYEHCCCGSSGISSSALRFDKKRADTLAMQSVS